jgi:DNA (cytosine-5)-methyltransferase 1
MTPPPLRAIEFFAGIGLMRLGLEQAEIETVWANDIDPGKGATYRENFGDADLVLADIRDISGADVPEADIATASFPCIDLSLAGNRKGLGREAARRDTYWESSTFWELARVLGEMGDRRPRTIVCENVLGLASSHGGRDLREAVAALNSLGYSCDVLALDARHFVPQSRPRMFIVGTLDPPETEQLLTPSELRPAWAVRFLESNPDLRLHAHPLPPPPAGPGSLDGYIERLPADHPDWWDADRVEAFVGSLSPLQAQRLDALRAAPRLHWRTAYRRTRQGRAVWEIRGDAIAGCLRTARGGSSKQAVVEAGAGDVRVRWMTANEYAALMGAPLHRHPARRNQALFGYGDAVCVPVIRWLCEQYVIPVSCRTSLRLLEAA